MNAQPRPKASPLRDFARNAGMLGVYFRLSEMRRAMAAPRPPAHAADGKPLPGRLAMMRIGGTANWQFFFERGKATANVLIDAARDAGADPQSWQRVLDWGCGCGRIARHMPSLTPAAIVGRDIDAYTVKWCAENLDGDFKRSALSPPLDIADASIDFVYGFSVLTHLSAQMQAAWFKELGRILKPGALAALTYHDRQHPAMDWVKLRSEQDGVSLTEQTLEGSNLVAAFQGIDTIERAAAPWFTLVSNIPRDVTAFEQSLAVLRRKQE